MSLAASLDFPSSRALAGWRGQLALFQPQRLWVGYLLFHRVEALSRIVRPLPQLSVLVLRALARESTEDDLVHRLQIGRQLLRRILHGLHQAELAHLTPARNWRLSPRGRNAAQTDALGEERYERRLYHFLDRGHRPPRFVHLGEHGGLPAGTVDGWTFDPACLVACTREPAAWQQQHGFPREVRDICTPGGDSLTDGDVPDWQKVILDQPERLCVVLLEAGTTAPTRLLAFEVQPIAWSLPSASPVFSLAGDWSDALPELNEDPPSAAWQRAWRQWCSPQGLSEAEIDACRLEASGWCLRVSAPASVLNRLRDLRSDASRADAWLLAGEGLIRAVARIETHQR